MRRPSEVTLTQPFGPLLRAGEILNHKYVIVRVLGRGGMGIVIGARHLRLDEPVALKLLLPEFASDPGIMARFLREARAASKIKSSYVPQIYDVDIMPPNIPYIVMEWLEGSDLMSLWREQKKLNPAFAVRCIIDACHALEIAHALGIVHRDLKPANLFLTRTQDGAELVKVLDFGISKQLDDSRTVSEERTQTGIMLGTLEYMAPEQIRSTKGVDARADIWSLGVTLYRLLTGKLPFHGSSPGDTAALVLGSQPAHPASLRPEIPEGLGTLILKCLEKQPDQRFGSARELIAALEPFAERTALLPQDRLSVSDERTHVVRKAAPLPPPISSRLPPPKRLGLLACGLMASGLLVLGLKYARLKPLAQTHTLPSADASSTAIQATPPILSAEASMPSKAAPSNPETKDRPTPKVKSTPQNTAAASARPVDISSSNAKEIYVFEPDPSQPEAGAGPADTAQLDEDYPPSPPKSKPSPSARSPPARDKAAQPKTDALQPDLEF